jgi:hypothetical protein
MEGKQGDLIVGIAVGIFGLIGLILSAGALDTEMYVFGLSLVIFAGLFIFGLVKRYYDENDVGHGADGQGGH